MGRVVSIVYTPADTADPRPKTHYARVPATRVRLVEKQGIEGDSKASRGRRQLNIMAAETVAGLRAEGFKTEPGELGEQIVVAGIDPATVAVGTRVWIGTATVEVTLPRTGCKRFERIQGGHLVDGDARGDGTGTGTAWSDDPNSPSPEPA